jgi:hypothetical protein
LLTFPLLQTLAGKVGGLQERGMLFTARHVARQTACLRGALIASTRPAATATLAATHALDSNLLGRTAHIVPLSCAVLTAEGGSGSGAAGR